MNHKPDTLLIATRNKGKIRLLKQFLTDITYNLVSLDDLGITEDVQETGVTYEENATLKAKRYAQLSGMLSLADDGGIEVDALDGEPGVYSARYAGPDSTDEEKIALLLDNMKDVPGHKRQATFVVVLALADPQGDVKLYRGEMTGAIATEPRGKPSKGLPYRQVFILDGYGKTLDELDEQGIPYVSHRQKALEKVKIDLNS